MTLVSCHGLSGWSIGWRVLCFGPKEYLFGSALYAMERLSIPCTAIFVSRDPLCLSKCKGSRISRSLGERRSGSLAGPKPDPFIGDHRPEVDRVSRRQSQCELPICSRQKARSSDPNSNSEQVCRRRLIRFTDHSHSSRTRRCKCCSYNLREGLRGSRVRPYR